MEPNLPVISPNVVQQSLSVSRRHLSQSQMTHGASQLNNPTSQIVSKHRSVFTSNQESQSVSSENQRGQLWGTNINEVEVMAKFQEFLQQYREEILPVSEQSSQRMVEEIQQGQLIYMNNIEILQACNYTLLIDGTHLYSYDKQLYRQLINFPAEMLCLFDEVVKILYVKRFPEEEANSYNILIGLVNLNKKDHNILRSLHHVNLNRLIQISGIVIRCSDVYPEMKAAKFECTKCGQIEQARLEKARLEEPTDCKKCKAKHSYQIIHNECLFTDKQYIKIQELPESVPDGETPLSTTLVAYDSVNVDSVKPGDRIQCIGIYRAQGIRQNKNKRTLKSIYNTYCDVVSLNRIQKNRYLAFTNANEARTDGIQYTDDEKDKFVALAQNPYLYDILVKSLAPSIWEQEDVKKGLLCQLFGGCQKYQEDSPMSFKGRFRADINCILVGDPSVAKSQLLSYVNRIAPRGIYTSGKGSSAVGLTAYVTRDPDTREIVLESGALVLSDMGICCIDEFDKMDENTRSILHEAMEQQTISIAKAGIVAQLNTRTAILAAANPLESKYNRNKTVVENINLPPTLLSRFDLIYIILDTAIEEKDKTLCRHILSLYTGAQSEQHQSSFNMSEDDGSWRNLPVLDKESFSRYISYARQEIRPQLTDQACKKLKEGYIAARQLGKNKNVITCTTRQLESAIRISESLAKMRLSQTVEERDVDEALRLIKVATQQAATDPNSGLIDMDVISTGRSSATREKLKKMIKFVDEIIKNNKNEFQSGRGMPFNQLLNLIREKYQAQTTESITEDDLAEVCRTLDESGRISITGNRKKPTFIKLGPTNTYE